MNTLHKGLVVVGLMMSACMSVTAATPEKMAANKKTAEAWVKATQAGKDETRAAVEKYMAADGKAQASRYVGFGFSYDPTNEDAMIVTVVVPDSPAAKVLKEGDEFVSVNGVQAVKENRARLSFRGKPGEAVKAVIKRDGKTMPIEVARGVIDTTNSKSELLESIDTGDAETWPVNDGSVVESLAEGNIVYVWDEIKDTDDDNGLPYTSRGVTRFEFNDEGKVTHVSGLSEDRFVLEQTGYSISR